MIEETDPTDDTAAFARPWWFMPALLGEALGGLLGLAFLLLLQGVPTTTGLISTSQPSSFTSASLLTPSPNAQVPPSQPAAPTPSSARPTLPPTPTLSIAPRDAVLAVADLPLGFGLSEERDDWMDHFGGSGYARGWLAFYNRTAQAGVASITAEVTAYASADDAEKALLEAVKYVTERWGVEIPLGQTIGDESHAIEYYPAAAGGNGAYGIWFRVANTSNVIRVDGRPGTVDVSAAADLAKKQVARLRGSVFAPVLQPACCGTPLPGSRGTYSEANGVITF